MKNSTIKMLGVLTLCALLAGCGSDGETTESTGVDTSTGGGGGGNGGGTSRNAGRLQFSVPSLNVAENAGNATLTVIRTDGTDGAVSVTVATRNGTASQPQDYTAVSTTVSFAAGDGAAKTVTIPVVDNSADEPDRTFYVTLSGATGGASLGSASEVLVTINDDDIAPPQAARAVVSSAATGLHFDWTAAAGATSYRIMKDAGGTGSYAQVGADLPATARAQDIAVGVLEENWSAAQYAIDACNAAGCTRSNTLAIAGLSASLITYVKPSNGREDDFFGAAVAMSADGNTLVVGAYGDAAPGTGVNADPARGDCNLWPTPADCLEQAGAVYVFTKVDGVWSAPVYIKAPVTQANGNFGAALSLSADGNTLAVGSYGVNAYRGAVYIYTRLAGEWQHQASLAASDAADYDYFGSEVALTPDGSMLAVGAPNRTEAGITYAGGVYVFTRSGATWTQQPDVLTPTTPSQYAYFGREVAIGGTAANPVLAVGAPGEDGLSSDPVPLTVYDVGAVYVFQLQGTTWTDSRLAIPTPDYYEYFGYSLAVSADGTTLAVGDESSLLDDSGNQLYSVGQVIVYSNAGGTWTPQATLVPSNATSSMYFGSALALSSDGSHLVAGARYEDNGGSGVDSPSDLFAVDSGAAYLFKRAGTTWSQARYLKPTNTRGEMYFGGPVAIDAEGTTLAVGATGESSPATTIGGSQFNDCRSGATECAESSGAVYVY